MSRSRTSWLRASALLLGALTLPAAGQDPSPPGTRGGGRVSEEHARAGDALVGLLFPGATRDWRTDELVYPDGRRVLVQFSGMTRLRVGDTWWIAAGVDFPERLAAETKRLMALESPAEAVRSRLVIAKAGLDFAVQDHRLVEVDPESPLSAVHKVEIVPPAPEARAFPQLRVWASSAALRGDAALVVSWQGVLDAQNAAWVSRQPRGIAEQREKAKLREDLVEARRQDGQVRFHRASTGELLGRACAEPCRARPLSVFDPPTP